MQKDKETGKEYTSFIILPSSNLKTLGEVVPLAQDKATSGRHLQVPLCWDASGKSEMHVIKVWGFFSSEGCSLSPLESDGEGPRIAAKQNLIIDQLSDCERNLPRAGQIACWGSLTI